MLKSGERLGQASTGCCLAFAAGLFVTNFLQVNEERFSLSPESKLALSESGQLCFYLKTEPLESEGILVGGESAGVELEYASPLNLSFFAPSGLELRLGSEERKAGGFAIRGLEGDTFLGDILIKEGRLWAEGQLVGSGSSPKRSLSFELSFDQRDWDWAAYRFFALSELEKANPNEVRYVSLRAGDLEVFPEILFEFGELRTLSLGQSWKEPVELNELPDCFHRFPKLEELSIQNFPRLETLPPSLGDLKALKKLQVFDCALRELPGEISKIPSLSHIAAARNQLATISELVSACPALEILSIPGNRLKSLPRSLGEHPKLRVLGIRDNPLESLPDTIDKIKHLQLESKKRKLFQETTYQSTNTEAIEQSLFQVVHDESLHGALAEELARWEELTPFSETVLRFARLCVVMNSFEEWDGKTLGLSRLGGWPDLPSGWKYPKDGDGELTFFCQLNLSELSPLQDYLPRNGMLYFFTADEEFFESPTVLYHHESEELQRFTPPENFKFSDSDRDEPYPAYSVKFMKSWSLPNIYGASEERFGEFYSDFEKLDEMAYEKAPDPYSTVDKFHHRKERSHGSHFINAYVFTQHESPEEQAAHHKGGEAQDWMNLLTLNYDQSLGFCFWDAGSLTFSIHKKDLAVGDFSNAHVTLESS